MLASPAWYVHNPAFSVTFLKSVQIGDDVKYLRLFAKYDYSFMNTCAHATTFVDHSKIFPWFIINTKKTGTYYIYVFTMRT